MSWRSKSVTEEWLMNCFMDAMKRFHLARSPPLSPSLFISGSPPSVWGMQRGGIALCLPRASHGFQSKNTHTHTHIIIFLLSPHEQKPSLLSLDVPSLFLFSCLTLSLVVFQCCFILSYISFTNGTVIYPPFLPLNGTHSWADTSLRQKEIYSSMFKDSLQVLGSGLLHSYCI